MSIRQSSESILVVSTRCDDHISLNNILHGSPWTLRSATTVSAALDLLRRRHYKTFAVICEPSLPDGDWTLLLAEANRLPGRPRIVVSSRVPNEQLWAEVLHHGAFDLIHTDPFDAEEVVRVVQGAWLFSSRERPGTIIPRIGPGHAARPHELTSKSIPARSCA